MHRTQGEVIGQDVKRAVCVLPSMGQNWKTGTEMEREKGEQVVDLVKLFLISRHLSDCEDKVSTPIPLVT